ncbi:hypothetical protein IV494_14540 [Kaistella sp. G5-32]|uniref:TtsA-like Glycoside hydrolase family 108 domain-containing protein n=2 Tax=Kaistella gelatinilytica TaxID=2787636 RepID=A0ABS0FFD1_9FLAO|nr:hypothetical protein [Kaistella gelatinilytica]
MDKIRKEIFKKYTGAKEDWNSGSDIFYLESFATTWVHFDVREFSQEYLIKKYFIKNSTELNGKNLVALALELGLSNTCRCLGGGNKSEPANATSNASSCEDKFKKVAPIILIHEGGYKNEPSKDKGDPTNKGISWPIWIKYAKEDLGVEPTENNQKKLTDAQATIIYRKRYWEPKGYCEIEDLKVALMIYDWSITSGGAIKEVQKLLRNEFAQNIIDDGGMGPLTAKAINSVEEQDKLLNRIAEVRREYYIKGAKEGWFSEDYSKDLDNRVTKCLNYEL